MAAPLGAAYGLGGRVADAVALLAPTRDQATATDMVEFQIPYNLTLGETQLLAGCGEAAYPLTVSTLALARERQERGHQAYALRLLGDIAARQAPPDLEQAEAHYLQALALAGELGMRPLQAHCHHGLGSLYATTGQTERARVELTTAIEMHRAMDMTFWLPEAESALAISFAISHPIGSSNTGGNHRPRPPQLR